MESGADGVRRVFLGTQGTGAPVAPLDRPGTEVCWEPAVKAARTVAGDEWRDSLPMLLLCSEARRVPAVSRKSAHQRGSRYIHDQQGRSP